jgi:hypothetical protein
MRSLRLTVALAIPSRSNPDRLVRTSALGLANSCKPGLDRSNTFSLKSNVVHVRHRCRVCKGIASYAFPRPQELSCNISRTRVGTKHATRAWVRQYVARTTLAVVENCIQGFTARTPRSHRCSLVCPTISMQLEQRMHFHRRQRIRKINGLGTTSTLRQFFRCLSCYFSQVDEW